MAGVEAASALLQRQPELLLLTAEEVERRWEGVRVELELGQVGEGEGGLGQVCVGGRGGRVGAWRW